MATTSRLRAVLGGREVMSHLAQKPRQVLHVLTYQLGNAEEFEVDERDRVDDFALDVERIMRAALERGCFLELNAQPDRLDLDDAHCKMAEELGLEVAVSTDAHSIANLDLMRFGIDQARRGWLEPGDVLNTRSWPRLRKLLRHA